METERFYQDITIGCDDGYTIEFNIICLKQFASFVQRWEGVLDMHPKLL